MIILVTGTKHAIIILRPPPSSYRYADVNYSRRVRHVMLRAVRPFRVFSTYSSGYSTSVAASAILTGQNLEAVDLVA
jgi:hypothetical protein